jgi:SAM-dependent methyltransferase
MIILYILLVLIALCLFVWQISNIISIFAGSLYVKTDTDLISFALKKAGLKQNDIFYDLGCGNGDVLMAAEKLGAHATGFEISPFYFLLSKLKSFNNKNIKIQFNNINNVSLKKVDVVYCYLLPKFLNKLTNKFLKDSPKKIISIGFEIIGLPGGQLYKYKNHQIFIYSLRSRCV